MEKKKKKNRELKNRWKELEHFTSGINVTENDEGSYGSLTQASQNSASSFCKELNSMLVQYKMLHDKVKTEKASKQNERRNSWNIHPASITLVFFSPLSIYIFYLPPPPLHCCCESSFNSIDILASTATFSLLVCINRYTHVWEHTNTVKQFGGYTYFVQCEAVRHESETKKTEWGEERNCSRDTLLVLCMHACVPSKLALCSCRQAAFKRRKKL